MTVRGRLARCSPRGGDGASATRRGAAFAAFAAGPDLDPDLDPDPAPDLEPDPALDLGRDGNPRFSRLP